MGGCARLARVAARFVRGASEVRSDTLTQPPSRILPSRPSMLLSALHIHSPPSSDDWRPCEDHGIHEPISGRLVSRYRPAKLNSGLHDAVTSIHRGMFRRGPSQSRHTHTNNTSKALFPSNCCRFTATDCSCMGATNTQSLQKGGVIAGIDLETFDCFITHHT